MIDINCKGADTLPLDVIEDFQGGLKKRTKADIDKIIKSIQTYGFSFPFFIWNGTGHNYCLDGHGRIQALAEMRRRGEDLPLFPVVYVEAKDEEEAKNKLLRLNSQYGEMTVDTVLEFAGDIQVEWEDLKLPSGEIRIQEPIDESIDAEPQIDRAEELRSEWGVEYGQLWRLGEHRLLCGDSTKKQDVDICLGNKVPFLMVTDPPYGINYNADWRNHAFRIDGSPSDGRAIGIVHNDNNADWTKAWELFPGNVMYIWHAGGKAHVVAENIIGVGFEIRTQIIWAKNNIVISRGHYHGKHEPCWYAVRKGKKSNWIGDRKQSTVWNIDKPLKSETGHSTQKPIECMARPIRNHESEYIYEPFSGSGTTIIACEQLKRKCRAIEISPEYVAVALQRYYDATGIKPELTE